MGASATFDQATLPVEPGGQADVQLRVRNTGTVVDSFTFEPVGIAPEWVSVAPAEIRLFPDTEEFVTVTVSPPRSAETPIGELTFALRVVSAEDPEGSVAEELTLEISAFGQRLGELHPRTSTGRTKGVHELAVDNFGNAPIEVTFAGIDADNTVEIEIKPPSLTVEPGHAAIAVVEVSPRKRFWRGKPKTLPFQVSIVHGDAEPEVVDGNFVQQPLVPPWLWKLLLAILLLLLLLWILWLTLLKPSVESTARDSVEEIVDEKIEPIDARLDAAGIPNIGDPPVDGGGGDDGGGGGGGGESTTTTTIAIGPGTTAPATTTTSTIPPTTVPGQTTTTAVVTTTTLAPISEAGPTDFRIEIYDAPGGPAEIGAQAVADGSTLEITDIIFQNPTGATGEVQIRRSGQEVLTLNLANFRNLDYHFVAPYVFEAGEQVEVWLFCLEQGDLLPLFDEDNPGSCRVGVSFIGYSITVS